MTTPTATRGGLKFRHVVTAFALVATFYLGYQVFGGFQRDVHDVTFEVSVTAPGRVTDVVWRADRAGHGNPSFTGHDWHHDVTLPGPDTYVLVLTATVRAKVVRDSFGNAIERGGAATCKIITHGGTASNVGPAEPRKGCNITKVIVVPATE
jgi:hypothetical protein